MSFHCNGDVGFDVVLDVYDRALKAHKILGTDHRWRVEHLGACRKEQFQRAAALGVEASMGPFQFLFWAASSTGRSSPRRSGRNGRPWGTRSTPGSRCRSTMTDP